MRAITSPINIISATVNLLPRILLQSVQAVWTLPFIWGRSLSMRSSPRFSEVVPQYTQGCRMYSKTSSEVKSQASIFLYAWRRKVARPLCVLFQRFCRAETFALRSSEREDHLSLRLSLPIFRSLWHGLHSYAKPSGRLFSRWKFSGFAGSSFLQRKQVRYIIAALYMPHTLGQGGK